MIDYSQVRDLDHAFTEALPAETMAAMSSIRSRYIQHRSAFISGTQMCDLLLELGARNEDLDEIQCVSDRLPADPTLPFRQSKNGRFFYDVEHNQIYRGEFQPFVLSADDDFVRHDSDQARMFAEIGDDLQSNSVLHALFRFNAYMAEGVEIARRPKLDYTSNRWVCTLFNLRTITTPELVGEPALEGVHCDGVDHTMTTLIGCDNMSDDSAITFIHDMRETNATRSDHADPDFVVAEYQHSHFLDTVLIADHERKHSLSPVAAADPSHRATRDMLIFFTRKPAAPGHVSFPYDSFRRHPSLPLCVELAPDERS